jgi:hypothetical protein
LMRFPQPSNRRFRSPPPSSHVARNRLLFEDIIAADVDLNSDTSSDTMHWNRVNLEAPPHSNMVDTFMETLLDENLALAMRLSMDDSNRSPARTRSSSQRTSPQRSIDARIAAKRDFGIDLPSYRPPRLAGKEESKCPICMEMAPSVVIDGCGHAFCTDCLHHYIDTATSRPVCPTCRYTIRRAISLFI